MKITSSLLRGEGTQIWGLSIQLTLVSMIWATRWPILSERETLFLPGACLHCEDSQATGRPGLGRKHSVTNTPSAELFLSPFLQAVRRRTAKKFCPGSCENAAVLGRTRQQAAWGSRVRDARSV